MRASHAFSPYTADVDPYRAFSPMYSHSPISFRRYKYIKREAPVNG